ncbi:endonuclease MutS2 [Bacillus sp. DTU_2020_1000418_1_SI_GHA_SEK_038]|uniref:endonuclease MutS2 n=1 Tax=Bacillus sp. DTU_2020_1000418_1_SI_GHA_SEK_038 TaxID=3077585 RepID=UPI0028EF9825|nr:endonuclease MutS2 [Bacillus sp. DTU_2020_1000418_1_SI_GHA_SEK_038]WNS75783.1 endonuclease MutS2 [Bacillus sp. DTU_2020_1000418_1_SI_GHA_SEK_038]
MNRQTIDVLGYQEILNEIANFAKTNRGKNTLQALRPLPDKRRMELSLKEIAEAEEIIKISSSVPIHTLDEMELYLTQARKGIYIRANQFTYVLSFLQHCSKLKQFMRDKYYAAPNVSLYAESIGEVRELEEEINRCIRHGQVDQHASSDLAYLRRQLSIQTDKLKEKAQQLVKSKRYAAYLQDTLLVERSGRIAISVKRQYRSKIQGTVLDSSASGSTLYMEPSELGSIQEEIELLRMSEEQETERILYELTDKVLQHDHTIKIAIETMHHYDVLFAKAAYSRKTGCSTPALNEDYVINLKEARHPMLGDKAVPLSIRFGEEHRALVITGPNTGGKTVTLKTVGLLTMMAQTGLPIPANPGSEIAIFQHIFVDIGDGQSIEQNLSTFSSRLVNIIDILRVTNDRSLVLLDELGSGTDPSEGMALAIVILEQLYQKGATLFATTHYNEMKEFAEKTSGFLNGMMEFDIDTLRPTYRLLLGQSGNSQAFDIAIKLGMHPELIEKAYQITYKTNRSYRNELDAAILKEPGYQKQIAINKYARRSAKKPYVDSSTESFFQFEQGDNVLLTETNEMGIIYKGPDSKGDYVVQIHGEKRTVNHKRLKLYIKGRELYPENYDFDIIFKSKEYRKINKQQKRKYVEGVWLDSED